ncbi:MAG: DUF4145 domain-containing protein [Anaerolineales bacterium]|nr:DUF4145 domain-containing protein [Anaerolineales bacterium]
MLLDKCPHCETSHVQTSPRFEESFDAETNELVWGVIRCQNPKCHRLILVVTSKGIVQYIYPVGSFQLDPKVNISQEIRDDFREAGLCLSAGCYKASMVMSRRVLQRCLKEQGASQRQLVDAIDYVMKEGILRKPFHKVATEIRQYGNLGAHPDDDQLVNVNEKNAKQVLDFVRLLIHDFYEVPAAAENLRQEREGSK